ncbi:hypothetical protein ACLKA7_009472 [Drosophila subpalustris]
MTTGKERLQTKKVLHPKYRNDTELIALSRNRNAIIQGLEDYCVFELQALSDNLLSVRVLRSCRSKVNMTQMNFCFRLVKTRKLLQSIELNGQ